MRTTTTDSLTDFIQNPDYDHCSPPPPYSLHDTASTANITIRSSRRSIATLNRGADADAKVLRLRKFLSFCLAVDYNAHLLTSDTLDKTTWCHFTSLFLIAANLLYSSVPQQKYPYPLVPSIWPSILTHPQLRKHIFEPSGKLGIHIDTSMSMLLNFAHQCHVSGYRSNIDQYAYLWDLKGLETKLRRDSEHLFDLLLPPEDHPLREAIEAKYLQVKQKWFTELHPEIATPSRKGRRKLRQERGRDYHWDHLSQIEGFPEDKRFRMSTFNWITRRCNIYLRLLQHPGNTLCKLSPWEWHWWSYVHKRERRFYVVDEKGLNAGRRRRFRFGPWSACRSIRYDVMGYKGIGDETYWRGRGSGSSMRSGSRVWEGLEV